MRLTAHPAHLPIGIKREIADGVDPFLLRLEVICDWRTVGSGKRSVAHEFEIWFRAACHHGHPCRYPIAAFRLDIAQNGFAFESIQTFSQEQRDAMFRE